jgi:hypothetical protein
MVYQDEFLVPYTIKCLVEYKALQIYHVLNLVQQIQNQLS